MCGKSNYIGGIAGDNGGVIKNCYVCAKSIEGTYGYGVEIGGIAGRSKSDREDNGIFNCCNLTPVTGAESSSSYGGVGGIVGWIDEGSVVNCYSIGKVEPYEGENCGGLIGYIYSSKTIVANCYRDIACAKCSWWQNPNNPPTENANTPNKSLNESVMRSTGFLSDLNANREGAASWSLWEIRSESPYPLPKPVTKLDGCQIQLAQSTYVYDGTEKEPAVVVTLGGQILVKDVDYSVTYLNNKYAGTAIILLEGDGNYMGEASAAFQILKAGRSFEGKKSFTKQMSDREFYLDIQPKGDNCILSYASSDGSVASVNQTGKVTLKGAGKADITVKAPETANYYQGTATVQITVKPSKVRIKSAVLRHGRLSVSWKKDKKADGYQLQYAKDKGFKTGVKTVTVKKKTSLRRKVLSGVKYVRVRAGSRGIYGKWSKKKVKL